MNFKQAYQRNNCQSQIFISRQIQAANFEDEARPRQQKLPLDASRHLLPVARLEDYISAFFTVMKLCKKIQENRLRYALLMH